jgi:exodeoxyribonuclease VII small subunit
MRLPATCGSTGNTMAKNAAPPATDESTASQHGAEQPASYEEALGELEQLVSKMESGALPLDQLLASYQRGAQLLKFCRSRLEAVEQQVKLLEDGQLRPWDDA